MTEKKKELDPLIHPEGQGNSPANTFDIDSFHNLTIGVIIFAREDGKVQFANRHFRSWDEDMGAEILEHVRREVISAPRWGNRSDFKTSDGTIIGYTLYQLSETRALVFLSDISYKKIYIENREENYFYNKLSRLIAEVVHELGNPLTSVTTTLQVLDMNLGKWDVEKQREYLSRAVQSIERLSGYLKKMRDFSMGSEQLDKKPVSLYSVVRRVLEHNAQRLQLWGIAVNCEVNPGVRVVVDEYLFFQVMQNLFINSADVLSNGEKGEITIRVEEVNEFFVKLSYGNNGPPIPQEILDRMFLPFYMFNSEKKGGAVGLALSLKLMTRMGGKLEAVNNPSGRGVIFYLYIPVYDQRQQDGVHNGE